MLDSADPPFWIDAEVDEFANDAQMEAVRRGLLITDSTTAEICEIDYTTDPVLPLDPRVIVIRAAIVEGQSLPLIRARLNWMEASFPGWRSHTGQFPTIYIDDWSSDNIRLYPTPTQSGTVLLTVAREPLEEMAATTDVPELPARWHRGLLQWMLYRGYSKEDSETYDPRRAAEAEGRFVAEFGEKKSARNERWAAETSGAVTQETLA